MISASASPVTPSPMRRVRLALSACAGRKPNPVTEVQDGDAQLSCRQLRDEIRVNNEAIRGLVDEKSQKTTQNIVAGTAGAVIFFPALFFMDLKGAAGEEARAYQRRNQGLLSRYQGKGCRPEIKVEKIKPGQASAEDGEDS